MSTKEKLLIYYATGRCLDEVKKQVMSGADINYKDPSDGRTALHLACNNEDIPMVEYLLSVGANKEIKDNNDLTPVQLTNNLEILILFDGTFNNKNPINSQSNQSKAQTGQENKEEKLIQVNIFKGAIYSIIGAVFLTPRDNLEKVKELIEKEVCNDYKSFQIYKHKSEGVNVPISSKQYYLRLDQIMNFENNEELLVILS